jgi:3-(3-hydroxy-phenyl)propionate hydroxylase
MPLKPHYSVVVVGAGPTGLVLANILGVEQVDTLVLERNERTVSEPRAVSIDDESLRTIQGVGLVDTVLGDIVQGYGSHYFSPSGSRFARVQPAVQEYGFPRRNAFRQPLLEAQLREGLRHYAHVEARFSHRLDSFEQDAGGVILKVAGPEGATQTVGCDYLVGCDGARSGVRERLGIAMEGSSFSERWLIVDLLGTPDRFRHTRVYCDPRRPAISLPGPNGTRRYEFMLHAEERDEDLLREEVIRQMIAERSTGDRDLQIARMVVYAFHTRVAQRWREGRVFLAGDAAHLSPPFAGQGMNSGVRDALNLGWKLASVVRRDLGPGLLDSYEQERKPHAWALIDMAMRIGRFMMPTGAVQAFLMQNLIRLLSVFPPARDYVMQMKFKPKPRYGAGFVVPDGAREAQSISGRLFVQPLVEAPGGRRMPLDDALGRGFRLLVYGPLPGNPQPEVPLPPQLTAERFFIVPQDYNFAHPLPGGGERTMLRDCDGGIEAQLRPFAPCAVLLRPDRYVAAVIPLSDPQTACRSLAALVEATRRSGV